VQGAASADLGGQGCKPHQRSPRVTLPQLPVQTGAAPRHSPAHTPRRSSSPHLAQTSDVTPQRASQEHGFGFPGKSEPGGNERDPVRNQFHSLLEVLHATSAHEGCTLRIRLTTRTQGRMQTQASNERTDGGAQTQEPVGRCCAASRWHFRRQRPARGFEGHVPSPSPRPWVRPGSSLPRQHRFLSTG